MRQKIVRLFAAAILFLSSLLTPVSVLGLSASAQAMPVSSFSPGTSQAATLPQPQGSLTVGRVACTREAGSNTLTLSFPVVITNTADVAASLPSQFIHLDGGQVDGTIAAHGQWSRTLVYHVDRSTRSVTVSVNLSTVPGSDGVQVPSPAAVVAVPAGCQRGTPGRTVTVRPPAPPPVITPVAPVAPPPPPPTVPHPRPVKVIIICVYEHGRCDCTESQH